MICIMGRTASGKDTLADMLKERGHKPVQSYATRAPRFEGEATHIFVSQEEADKIKNRVATTKIGDVEYFATLEQFKDADFYVIDPNGLKTLEENLAEMDDDERITVVYVSATPGQRSKRNILRSSGKIFDAMKAFNERNWAEDKQFSEFENMATEDILNTFPHVSRVVFYNNVECNEYKENFEKLIENLEVENRE